MHKAPVDCNYIRYD